MSSLIIVSYKCVMKHEGYIPATVVSGGDTLTIRKKISGSAYLSACEISSCRLKSVICIIQQFGKQDQYNRKVFQYDIYVFIAITRSIPFLVGYLSPMVSSTQQSTFEQRHSSRFIYVCNLQFLNNVIINKDVLLPHTQVTLDNFSYLVQIIQF